MSFIYFRSTLCSNTQQVVSRVPVNTPALKLAGHSVSVSGADTMVVGKLTAFPLW